jgi:hypothetical protein
MRDVRPQTTTTTGAEVEPLPPVTPPAAPPAALTPTQEQWLATLDATERERFNELPVTAQQRLLDWHRDRLNDCRILAAETARILRPKIEAAPPPELPETTPELLEQLPGGPAHWPQRAAESLARDFGTATDQKLWPAFLKLTMAIWRGDVPAALVIDAYQQGMGPKAKSKGAVFCHALKRNGIFCEGPGVTLHSVVKGL